MILIKDPDGLFQCALPVKGNNIPSMGHDILGILVIKSKDILDHLRLGGPEISPFMAFIDHGKDLLLCYIKGGMPRIHPKEPGHKKSHLSQKHLKRPKDPVENQIQGAAGPNRLPGSGRSHIYRNIDTKKQKQKEMQHNQNHSAVQGHRKRRQSIEKSSKGSQIETSSQKPSGTDETAPFDLIVLHNRKSSISLRGLEILKSGGSGCHHNLKYRKEYHDSKGAKLSLGHFLPP